MVCHDCGHENASHNLMCAYCGFQFIIPNIAFAPQSWVRRWWRKLVCGTALLVSLAIFVAVLTFLLR